MTQQRLFTEPICDTCKPECGDDCRGECGCEYCFENGGDPLPEDWTDPTPCAKCGEWPCRTKDCGSIGGECMPREVPAWLMAMITKGATK